MTECEKCSIKAERVSTVTGDAGELAWEVKHAPPASNTGNTNRLVLNR